jgi:hypothetical protein
MVSVDPLHQSPSDFLPPHAQAPVSRSLAVNLIRTALAVGEARFARQAALAWLAAYPGDLPVGLLHTEALLQELRHASLTSRPLNAYDRPIAILQTICQADPEYREAQETLARALFALRLGGGHEPGEPGPGDAGSRRKGMPSLDAPTLRRADMDTFGDVLALAGRLQPGMPAPEWSYGLRQARQAIAHVIQDKKTPSPKGLPHSIRATGTNEEDHRLRENAERLVHEVLLANPTTPLAAVTHLKWEADRELPLLAIRSLANVYHERWPGCVLFILMLADAWMDSGESERAVALLHQAVALDVTGQVARRLWGEAHPYQALWPDRLEAPILQDLPVPAAVSAALGWNQLPPGAVGMEIGKRTGKTIPANEISPAPGSFESPVQPPPGAHKQSPAEPPPPPYLFTKEPEVPISVQPELDRLAASLHQPQLARADGRFPVYVIFTTRRGLQAQYGEETAALIEQGMLRLVEAARLRRGWSALLFYADEGLAIPAAGPLAALRRDPARYNDPWSLKLALADLDAALGRRGEMIGALLIAGGPEVVPFHRLPNPVDDADVDVPSDNPYATRDENYFIPEWPVGRLPGGKGSDPGLLLRALDSYACRHREEARRKSWAARWWEELRQAWLVSSRRLRPGLGYTAAVWKQASQSVFRPVDKGRGLLVSPPLQAEDQAAPAAGQPAWAEPESAADNGRLPLPRNGHAHHLPLHPARLGYFNLHGLSDAVEWYGQRDPSGPAGGPDYPVALRPQDVGPCKHAGPKNNGSPNGNGRRVCPAPHIVFTEACYGAHILDKAVGEALALTFLASGSQAVAGATCIAYGAIADPLTAADLLGYAFWKSLGQGLPAGEALRRAKIHLAREMHRRQGYLDGEDQKTLISFVLYGDPLAQPLKATRSPKAILRPLSPPAQVKIVCDRSANGGGTRPVPPEVMRYVKSVVAQYLPGMADAQVRLSEEHASCQGGSHQCPTSQIGAKARPAREPHRRVVTLQKTIPAAASGCALQHHQYARLTLDESGKLVKLVVSR